jgi:hypothetical protein
MGRVRDIGATTLLQGRRSSNAATLVTATMCASAAKTQCRLINQQYPQRTLVKRGNRRLIHRRHRRLHPRQRNSGTRPTASVLGRQRSLVTYHHIIRQLNPKEWDSKTSSTISVRLFYPFAFALSLLSPTLTRALWMRYAPLGGFDMGWWFMNKKSSMYTAASNQWRTLSDMPLANGGTGISHMGNTVWPGGRQIILTGGIGLGFSRNTNAWPAALSRQEVYTMNVDSRSWGRLPNMPGDRGGMGAAVVGSTLYVFGGGTFGWAGNRWDFLADHTDTWSLNLNNPNAGWSTRGRMRTARNHIGAAAVNGIVYALGGQNLEMEGCTNKNVVEAYNPATNRWTTISSMPVKLGHIGPSVLSPSMGFNYGMIVVSGTTDSGNSCSPPGENVTPVNRRLCVRVHQARDVLL